MGTTTRQRAYRRLREAKRVVQAAYAAGHLRTERAEDGEALCQQVVDLLAGEYPCTVTVDVEPSYMHPAGFRQLGTTRVFFTGWYDLTAKGESVRIALRKLNVLTVQT